jgi:drug/metabolite transporter (DMT)-like permease
MENRSLVLVYMKLVLAAVFWGGTFIAGRVLAGGVGPFSASFLRFLIASIVLIIVVWRMEGRIPLPSKRHLFSIFLLGLTGIFLYNFCFFKGLEYIEAGRASVIVANNPIFIALLSAYFFKEKLTFLKIVGIIISIIGAVVVITKGDFSAIFQDKIGPGELFILSTVASWVVYSLVGKVLMKDISAVLSVTYSVLAGTVLLLIPAFLEGLGGNIFFYTPIDWLCLTYLGIFGTVLAFIFYYQGIISIGPTKAGLFINFVPISGVILSYLFLRETITISLLSGLVFVCLGIYLTNRKTSEEKQKTQKLRKTEK